MIRAVATKALDLSDDEFEYYLQIVKEFGPRIFDNIFETDDATGFITLVKPPMNATMPMGVIFFCFNVMLNQRVREFEKMMQEAKEKLK